MTKGRLKEFTYSPGYGDMQGAMHQKILKKDDKGSWVIVSRDKELFSDPIIAVTYAVSEEAVLQFEAFLKENEIWELEKRKDRDFFVSDYSPWRYEILFDNPAAPLKRDLCRITGYKEYSDADMKLLDEVNKRFKEMQGKKLSEEKEK